MGFAQIVSEDQSLPEEHRRNLGLITRNGQQLLRIVDEILDISKIESDRMDLEHIFFNLKDLVLDVVTLLSVKAKEKNLLLKTQFEDSVPEGIRSDPTRLRQVLINIIGNAIKFTHQGSIELWISAEPAMPDGQMRIAFKISDSGIGLSAEQAKSLFQPFTQADSSMTRKFGGTGLGLFLSRKLARMLGGDLVLDFSEPDRGSVFIFTLKARDVQFFVERTKAAAGARVKPDASGATTEAGKGHILVIDDSEDNRFLVSWYLKKIGFTCDLAESGDEGLKKIERARYGLVLLDIQMPGMDGFKVLDELKKKMRYPGPVVALTAHAMKGDRERCLDAGFDGYLTKPIEEKALRDSLAAVISTRRP
jgi:CheY-like chemotaxis protein